MRNLPVHNTISFTKININILSENTKIFHGTILLPLLANHNHLIKVSLWYVWNGSQAVVILLFSKTLGF